MRVVARRRYERVIETGRAESFDATHAGERRRVAVAARARAARSSARDADHLARHPAARRARPHARRVFAGARSVGTDVPARRRRDGDGAREPRRDGARQCAAVPDDPRPGPAQERIPGDARARAAQSADADHQRAVHHGPAGRRRREAGLGEEGDRAPDSSARPPGRRLARRLADHAGQDRACASGTSTSRKSLPRRSRPRGR